MGQISVGLKNIHLTCDNKTTSKMDLQSQTNKKTKFKVTVDLQRPNFANFFFFVPDIAKISI